MKLKVVLTSLLLVSVVLSSSVLIESAIVEPQQYVQSLVSSIPGETAVLTHCIKKTAKQQSTVDLSFWMQTCLIV
ncbi:hypothetical protein LWI29_016494 [Acer saccharum]|uniref:Secreted protein n=1 Tax=Acer saccharum TaxID=4024 RepID=A0AA39RS57_ACESA|nr:hypothetical protein LWI29_016494 [Acer saccharum]